MACFADPWTEMTGHFFVQSYNHSKERNKLRKMKSWKNSGINTLQMEKEYILSSYNITKIILYNYIYTHYAINEIPRC